MIGNSYMDILSKKQRYKSMRGNKSHDTKPEVILRKALWHKGIRYRKNWRKLTGSPDIVLIHQKIAIFVDGDFWHARDFQDEPGQQIKTNQNYWQKKLSRNVERDKEVTDTLTEEGWLVLRFWESDIKKNLNNIVTEIMSYM